MAAVKNWLCIQCGHVLGDVLGGELKVLVPEGYARTRGANLTVRCPECEAEKTWYTADPIVRSIYQLVDSIAPLAARRMIESAVAQIKAQR